jgi:hypothetical protein
MGVSKVSTEEQKEKDTKSEINKNNLINEVYNKKFFEGIHNKIKNIHVIDSSKLSIFYPGEGSCFY